MKKSGKKASGIVRQVLRYPNYVLDLLVRRRPGRLKWFLLLSKLSNAVSASLNPVASIKSNKELRKFRATLDEFGHSVVAEWGKADTIQVPALHFVYGLKQAEPLPLYAMMAILSAQAYHPRAKTFFYYQYEPTGHFWEIIKPSVQLVKTPQIDWFGPARIKHYAHKADVVRLLALYHIGGLYLDIDTLTLKSMDELAGYDFVMGVQQSIPGAVGGLCNAIMMGRPRSRFAHRWISQYSAFRSSGRDRLWDFHSVKLPAYLYSKNPRLLHVLNHDKWFFPLWTRIEEALLTDHKAKEIGHLFDDQYAIHLWNNVAGTSFEKITIQDIEANKQLYSEFCREALLTLPQEDLSKILAILEIRIEKTHH